CSSDLALTVFEEVMNARGLDQGWKRFIAKEMELVLGLNILALLRHDLRLRPKSARITEAEIETILSQRQQARAAKDFATSDRLRDELTAKGVEVMDGDPLGWDWKLG
ncbi:MAG: hypothetical protein RLY97_1222, partial [Pseudomonadota bacterium]